MISEIMKQREIGGYFELEEFAHKEYYQNLIAVNSCRNALVYLVRMKRINKIMLPFFLCDVVNSACEREKCEISYYHINSEFQPLLDREPAGDEWVYIVNYYGQITNEKELKKKYGRVIIDNAQAFFRKPFPGIDTIYSCRKFFGVPDGGYVSTDIEDCQLKIDISNKRMNHILGRYEETAAKYYDSYLNNENLFDNMKLMGMSKITHNLLGAIDYKKIKSKRSENFMYLHELLGNKNELNIKLPEGPMTYPFYYTSAKELRNKLISNCIYVPIYWKNALWRASGIEKDYIENILPLPCDQRYNVDDMNRIVDIILSGGF